MYDSGTCIIMMLMYGAFLKSFQMDWAFIMRHHFQQCPSGPPPPPSTPSFWAESWALAFFQN